jgi:hypothetical protein
LNYAFTISARDTDRSSYYAISFGPEVTVVMGTYHFMPTAVAKSMFAVWPMEVQAQFPPSSEISGSATITTSTRQVTGEIIISPALAVPVTFALWGQAKIGDVTVPPGETAVRFAFDLPD